MENASKALLIAGAILLVIAIIAIAVGIVSNTRGTMDIAGQQIDNMAIQMHNKQFEPYNKKELTGAEAQELVSAVLANNRSTNNRDLKVDLDLCSYTNSWDEYNWIGIWGDDYWSGEEKNGHYREEEGVASIRYAKKYTCQVSYNSKGIIYYFYLEGIL